MDDIKAAVKLAIKRLANDISDRVDSGERKDLADAAAKLSVTLHNLTVIEDQERHNREIQTIDEVGPRPN